MRNLDTGAVEITSQNHGFAIAEDDGRADGAPDLRVTHRNLNDGTLEGLRGLDVDAYSVQFHPEAAPGPNDAAALFDEFVDRASDAA